METRVVAVAAMGSFVSALSASVVGVILPGIGQWANIGILDVQWVSLLPLLVISSVLLPAGRLADIHGHRRVYLWGIALVGLGSLGCAIAAGFQMFLVSRAVSGIGAAMTMATAPALVSIAASPGRRGRALGLVSTGIYVGLTFGPPLGGLLESTGSFRTVFWAQVLLIGMLLLFTWRMMPEVEGGKGRRKIDHAGAMLLTFGMSGLLLALTRRDFWGGPVVWTCALIGVAGMLGFALLERKRETPLLDFSLFSNRQFLTAVTGAFLNYVAIFSTAFLMPFYLEDTLEMMAREAGYYLMAMPFVMSIVAGPSGYLSDRIGSRVLSVAGMGIMAVGIALLTTQGQDRDAFGLIACLCLIGLGTGVFISPNTNALMSSAPRERQGSAAGVMALARTVGMMIGTALSATIYHMAGDSAAASGAPEVQAGVAGLHAAWIMGAVIAAAGAIIVGMRNKQRVTDNGYGND